MLDLSVLVQLDLFFVAVPQTAEGWCDELDSFGEEMRHEWLSL